MKEKETFNLSARPELCCLKSENQFWTKKKEFTNGWLKSFATFVTERELSRKKTG